MEDFTVLAILVGVAIFLAIVSTASLSIWLGAKARKQKENAAVIHMEYCRAYLQGSRRI
jgi:type II secretory pathway pseudopilin PulG